jgi:hypothetical protein
MKRKRRKIHRRLQLSKRHFSGNPGFHWNNRNRFPLALVQIWSMSQLVDGRVSLSKR